MSVFPCSRVTDDDDDDDDGGGGGGARPQSFGPFPVVVLAAVRLSRDCACSSQYFRRWGGTRRWAAGSFFFFFLSFLFSFLFSFFFALGPCRCVGGNIVAP
jgi:hypothetical protein